MKAFNKNEGERASGINDTEKQELIKHDWLVGHTCRLNNKYWFEWEQFVLNQVQRKRGNLNILKGKIN